MLLLIVQVFGWIAQSQEVVRASDAAVPSMTVLQYPTRTAIPEVMKFSADGKFLFARPKGTNPALVWETATGKQLLLVTLGKEITDGSIELGGADPQLFVTELNFRPSKPTFFSWQSPNRDRVRRWRLSDGKLLDPFQYETGFNPVSVMLADKYLVTHEWYDREIKGAKKLAFDASTSVWDIERKSKRELSKNFPKVISLPAKDRVLVQTVENENAAFPRPLLKIVRLSDLVVLAERSCDFIDIDQHETMIVHGFERQLKYVLIETNVIDLQKPHPLKRTFRLLDIENLKDVATMPQFPTDAVLHVFAHWGELWLVDATDAISAHRIGPRFESVGRYRLRKLPEKRQLIDALQSYGHCLMITGNDPGGNFTTVAIYDVVKGSLVKNFELPVSFSKLVFNREAAGAAIATPGAVHVIRLPPK